MYRYGYEIERIYDNTFRIIEPIGSNYLIIGSQRGILIDTGLGIGNLKGLVEELNDQKPYDVVNTHGHFDHVYGDYQFPEIYISRTDLKLLEESYQKESIERNTALFSRFYPSAEYLQRLKRNSFDFRTIDLKEGHIFDLGDTEIETIHVPGHTEGHMCFLDKRNRRLFAGDSMMRHTTIANGGGASIKEFISGLKKVYERREEFDCFLPAHGHGDGFRSLGPEYIAKLMDCMEQFNLEDAEAIESEMGYPSYRYLLDQIPYSDPESVCITVTADQWNDYMKTELQKKIEIN